MIRTEDIANVKDGHVYGSDGGKIGSVGQVYLDNQTSQPAWVTVKTGLFGTRASFVPLAEADVDGPNLRVPYDKHKVKDAPNIDADGELTPEEEDELYRYYGVDSGEHDTAAQGGGHHAAAQGDAGRDEGAHQGEAAAAGTAAAGERAAGGHHEYREHGERREHGEHHERREGGEHRGGETGPREERRSAGGEGQEPGVTPGRRIRRYIVTEEVITRREEIPEEGDPNQPRHEHDR